LNKNEFDTLIKESFKDIAIRLYELNDLDKQSLLSEYREWIETNSSFSDVLMLPYEAYTDIIDNNSLEDL
tara:strand:- start:450 stop:659 length:210 start_codon:yes stop_codon:yes gene_type:complete